MVGLAGERDQNFKETIPISVTKAARIHINGIVQGVGFRPFVFNLAMEHGIKGWVRNTSAGVDIEAEATQEQLTAFIQDLETKAPPLSQIDQFIV